MQSNAELVRTIYTPASKKGSAQAKARSKRSSFLIWMRNTHLYLGLWGALLGMMFGVTGIVLNHRVVMKMPIQKAVQTTINMELPENGFKTPEQLASWISRELKLNLVQPAFIKVIPKEAVAWGNTTITQPERWSISFHRPDRAINVDYFVGSKVLRLENADSTLIGTLIRLHMAVGVNALWVVLTDSIAASFILLSLTGLLLWTQMHTLRLVALAVSLTAFIVALVTALSI